DGSIVCCTNNGAGWRRYPIIASKRGDGVIYAVRAVCISNRLNIWYCIEYNGKKMLVHQIVDGEDVIGEPYVVDYLGYKKNYDICCDNDMNTHVYYVDENENLSTVRYLWSQKKYATREQVASRVNNVAAIADMAGNIYIAAIGRKSDFNVVYFKRQGEEDFRILSFGVDSTCVPAVVKAGDRLYVQWIDNKECCECASTDGGDSFEHPVAINRMSGGTNGIIAYKNSANPLCIGINRCICNYAMKMLHEAAIIGSINKPTNMSDELTDYCKNAAQTMQVSLDVVSRLCALENQLSAIAQLLQHISTFQNSSDADDVHHQNINMTGDVSDE
ncbi:MAG: hypothetical protein IJ365_05380, partial [Clostridia bacterium]|nr:hypothetical protein [Clostridia bacterium]